MDQYYCDGKSKKPPAPAPGKRCRCSTTMVTMLLFVLTNTTSVLLSSGAGAFLLRRYKPNNVRLWAWDDSAALLDDLNATQSALAASHLQLADLHARLGVANSLLETLLAGMATPTRHATAEQREDTSWWPRDLAGELKLAVGNVTGDDVFPAVGHACGRFREEMEVYMNYTAGGECLSDEAVAHRLMLKGCDPLPRRRCRTRSTTEPPPRGGEEKGPRWMRDDGALSYSVDAVLAARPNGTVRVGLDIGGVSGAFAARMRERGVTVVTTAMSSGGLIASRGLVPVHVGPAHRLPFFDGTLDVVHWATPELGGRLPVTDVIMLEFAMFDIYRVLRPGGLFWLDQFVFSGERLNATFAPMIDRVGFKRLRWNTGKKQLVSALLEKPMT